MKSLRDIQMEMSELYDAVKADETDLKKAAELANIAGKHLKAESLILAREMWESPNGKPKLIEKETARRLSATK